MKKIIILSFLTLFAYQPIFAETLTLDNNSGNKSSIKSYKPSRNKTHLTPNNINELDFSKSLYSSINENGLKESDLSISLNYIKEKKGYSIHFNKHDGSSFNEEDLLPLEKNSDSFIHIYWLNSALSSFYEQELYLDDNSSNQYFMPIPKITNKCSAFYLTYHLNGEQYATTQKLLIGKKGSVIDSMDASCPRPYAEAQEELTYTSSSYIVGTHWSNAILTTHKPVSFQATFTKEGKEVLPDDLKSYAVSKNFHYFYMMNQSQNKNGLHKMDYGIQFSNFITYPQTYYFNIQFQTNDGKENSFINIKNILN